MTHLARLVVLHFFGPLRSKLAHFALSFFGVVAGARVAEQWLGAGDVQLKLPIK